MPALFDVPGWPVPSVPVSTQRQSRKRKRNASSSEQELLRNAQANLDRVIDSLGGSGDNSEDGSSKKKKRKSHNGKLTSQPPNHDQEDHRPNRKPHNRTNVPPHTSSSEAALPSKKQKKNTKNAVHTPKHPTAAQNTDNLTLLQRNMKKGLDGARFRLLNETLYKSSSHEAVKVMKEDPKIFQDYHVGFRRQVQAWPSNPVSHYVSKLSSYPAKTVIADLGCGDAALGRALVTKNFTVLSFDLVSDGAYVIEADICSQLPLPGSEPQSAECVQGMAQIVDVVVCALSLMSTNWPRCISEAWRILRPGGELMIAEVASRFTSVDEFASLISAIGFRLQDKDERNSHFTLFRFKKVARSMIPEEEWTGLMLRGRVLKSCEYKRR